MNWYDTNLNLQEDMKIIDEIDEEMLRTKSFNFYVVQIVIDFCCATFAEVQKKGKDFWDEFELYDAYLLVGLVVDITLVGMLAPYARIEKQLVASGGLFSC